MTDNEGNQIIAEFMGFRPDEEFPRYSNSWDLLMPVIESLHQFKDSPRPFIYGNPESVFIRILEDRVTSRGSFWTDPNSKDGNSWQYFKKSLKFKNMDPLLCWCVVTELIEWIVKIQNENNIS